MEYLILMACVAASGALGMADLGTQAHRVIAGRGVVSAGSSAGAMAVSSQAGSDSTVLIAGILPLSSGADRGGANAKGTDTSAIPVETKVSASSAADGSGGQVAVTKDVAMVERMVAEDVRAAQNGAGGKDAKGKGQDRRANRNGGSFAPSADTNIPTTLPEEIPGSQALADKVQAEPKDAKALGATPLPRGTADATESTIARINGADPTATLARQSLAKTLKDDFFAAGRSFRHFARLLVAFSEPGSAVPRLSAADAKLGIRAYGQRKAVESAVNTFAAAQAFAAARPQRIADTRAADDAAMNALMAQLPGEWANPFPGVVTYHKNTTTDIPGQDIHVAFVDLCAPGVSVSTTPFGAGAGGPDVQGPRNGAQMAVNANFYNMSNPLETHGWVIQNGQLWGGPDVGYSAPIIFGPGRAEIRYTGFIEAQEPWMQVSVSGHPSLVVDGYAVQNHPDRNLGNASGVLTDGVLCTKRDPRTIVGLNKDQTRLMVVTVDGRGPGRAGMTCAEAADYMVRLGAYTALNLDGGGSTAMWQEGAGILNRPSDGFTRPVANTLNIHAPHHGAAPGQFGGPPADNAPGPYCAVP